MPFVARQQHIVTETEDYYIDLVFYNIKLKCYVLIDLKMGIVISLSGEKKRVAPKRKAARFLYMNNSDNHKKQEKSKILPPDNMV